MQYIDYHIEINDLHEYATSCQSEMSKHCLYVIYQSMKEAVYNSGSKPFLLAKSLDYQNDDPYYEKYLRIEQDNKNMAYGLPEIFLRDGDFYDLQSILHVRLDTIGFEAQQVLFSLKLSEVFKNQFSISTFLNFQVYDNFGGDQAMFAGFLRQLLAVANNCCLLPAAIPEIHVWLSDNGWNDDYSNELNNKSSIEAATFKIDNVVKENLLDEPLMDQDKNSDLLKLKQSYKIQGRFSDEEVRKFFSFLFNEKSCDGHPFLSEEDFNEVFKNGLLIPAIPVENKYHLNVDARFPKKIIDCGIYTLFCMHSIKNKGKKDYFLFFASYFDNYADLLVAEKNLTNYASNMTEKSTGRVRFKFENYFSDAMKKYPLLK